MTQPVDLLLHKIFGVQPLKLRQDKASVLSDQNAVKPYLAAAVFRRLDADQIPVQRRLVAVVAVVVAASRGEVEADRRQLLLPGVKWKLPAIFSSNSVSFIGTLI